MTTQPPSTPTYRVIALENAPKPHCGRPMVSSTTLAFTALQTNEVAVFEPCPLPHKRDRSGNAYCQSALAAHAYALHHKLGCKTWHLNGNLYIHKAGLA